MPSPRPLAVKQPEVIAAPQYTGPAQDSNLVTPLGRLAETPEYVDCPSCQQRAITRVEKSDSSQTKYVGNIRSLFGLFADIIVESQQSCAVCSAVLYPFAFHSYVNGLQTSTTLARNATHHLSTFRTMRLLK